MARKKIAYQRINLLCASIHINYRGAAKGVSRKQLYREGLMRDVNIMFRFYRARMAVPPFLFRKEQNRQVKIGTECFMESDHCFDRSGMIMEKAAHLTGGKI